MTRTALVTGGAQGIGAAIVETLASRGYRVAILDLDPDATAKAAAQYDAAVACPCDVSDPNAVEAVFEGLDFVPDLVVNNAGIVRFGALHEQSLEDFTKVVAVNLNGVYFVTRSAVTRMLPRGSGHVISLTSINVYGPGPNSGAYPASKAGVKQLMRQCTLEYGESGLRFNSIAPGFIDGGMSAPIFADPRVREVRSGGVPIKRLGKPSDIAEAVAFLDSEGGNYINGHDLVVDGGVINAVLKNLPRN